MRKNYLYLILAIVCTFNAIAQNIPSYVPKDGLVGYWPFNGNANDESGNGNHGTVNGASLTSDRNGVANSAYDFDGLKSFISILFSDKLYNSVGTLNCWIKTDGVFNEQKLIFGQPWGRPQLVVNPDNIGNNHTAAIQWKDKEDAFPFISSNSQVEKSEWIMITGIYSPTEFKILINGVLENSTIVSKIQDNNKLDFQIGGFNIPENGYSYRQMFKGQIDEISLYNRALSEQEITALYTGNPVATIPSYVPKDGLVGYWPFNGNANDESGNGNHGTVNGASLTSDRNGVANSAYSFEGLNNYIDVLNLNSTKLNKDFTISSWINIKSFDALYPQVVNGDSNYIAIQLGGSVYINDLEMYKKLVFYYSPGPNFTKSNTTLTTETYYFVTSVRKADSIFLFINGKKQIASNFNNASIAKGNFIRIGSYAPSVNSDYNRGDFDGKIDEITIHNRALTEQEITALYTSTPVAQNIPSYVPKDGLVGYWPFNGNANDESGNGNHGTVNGATLAADRDGVDNNSYDFDGKSNFIEVAHSNSLNLSSNGMSFNLWMKVPEFPSDEKEHYFLSKHSGIGTSMNGFHATLSNYMNSNSLFYRYKTENNEWGGNGFLNNLLKTNNWFQVTIVVDSIYDYIYLNGKLLSRKTKQPDVKYGENSGSLFFGKDVNFPISSTDGLYLGQLDDIAIYNRALTENEIAQLYTNCTKETATSSSFNSLLFTNGSAVSVTAEPQGGVFSGASIQNNQFIPSKAKIGSNKVKYNFKNSKGCADSTVFNMVVADTVGASCTKYDTVTVTNNVTKYDTITVTNNVTKYDTLKVTKFDTVTITNNVTKYDTLKVTKFDTVTVTNNVTKYDTVIVKTNVFDTVKVTKYDTLKVTKFDTVTVTNNVTKYDTVIINKTKYDTVIVKTNVFDTLKVTKYDTLTVTNNITKYDTVIVKTNVFDTVKVTKYDTLTVTNNVIKYDTVKVTKYDTLTVKNNIYDTVSILKIKFKLTTGIHANQLSSLSIYPNPTSDVLHIEVPDAKVLEGYRYRILDALGKEVYNQLVTQSTTEIPLKTLGAAGIYQFEILDATKTSIQSNKIVLQ